MGYALGALLTLDIALFVAGAFSAAFVTGLAGFAFGIGAAAVWLHFLPRGQGRWLVVVQVAGVGVLVVPGLWLGGTGMIGADTLRLLLIGLPALGVGTWAGLKLFGKIDEAAFRRVILALLLISGLGLLILGR